MKYKIIILSLLVVLLSAGCRTYRRPIMRTNLEVWDCRSGKPQRMSGKDPLAPTFRDMYLPKRPPAAKPASAPKGKSPKKKK